MSEELLQRDLKKNPEKIGKWDFYNIGSTSVKDLKEYGIIRNVNYGKEERKKVDALIVQQKNVIAVIEYKKPSQFKTKTQQNKAIKQEIEVAKKIGAKIIIATDTKESIWVNVSSGERIKGEDGNDFQCIFDPKDEGLPELIQKIILSINEINNQIKPRELVNPTNLAKQIWQDIWSVSGATPENCLYTFVELFIFKYLSDLNILGEGINFDHLQDRYKYKINNPDEEALEYYANTIRPQIRRLFQVGNDNTTIINGTIFVSKDQKAVKGYSTVFKKVLGRFKDYGKLEYIDKDFKSQLFESFLKESFSKKNWGQFFTPLKIVRAITEMAKDEIRVGSKICDPACGVGKFLLEPIATRLNEFFEIKDNKLHSEIILHGFDKGFDKDEQKTIILAKANMLIYFSDLIKENPSITKKFSSLFNESFVLKTNSILGTLSDVEENEYDLILTNPPYVTSGSSNLKEEIRKDGDLVNHYKINAMGVEGLFMEWIVRALKPNGKAFIVVPDGIFNRKNDKNLRQFIIDECFVDGIISLPLNTFFTTPKKTYILALTKKMDRRVKQESPVFSYLVSEIGESRDIYRFDIEQNDLVEAVTLYTFFKGNKENFSKINADKRCKIFPFKSFEKSVEKSWTIDKWWTENEKIEIGISEKKEKVGLLEFSNLIEDITNSIGGSQEEIKEEINSQISRDSNTKNMAIKEIFDLSHKTNNSKFTKTFIDKNKGNIPVYSASKFPNTVSYGYVKDNLKGVNYFENCLTWNIDGSIGKAHYRSGRFSLSEKVIPLIVHKDLEKYFDIYFLKNQIENEFNKHDFGFNNKASKGKISNIQLQIPISKDGEIDIERQKELVKKIRFIDKIKNQISLELDKLLSTNVDYK